MAKKYRDTRQIRISNIKRFNMFAGVFQDKYKRWKYCYNCSVCNRKVTKRLFDNPDYVEWKMSCKRCRNRCEVKIFNEWGQS